MRKSSRSHVIAMIKLLKAYRGRNMKKDIDKIYADIDKFFSEFTYREH